MCGGSTAGAMRAPAMRRPSISLGLLALTVAGGTPAAPTDVSIYNCTMKPAEGLKTYWLPWNAAAFNKQQSIVLEISDRPSQRLLTRIAEILLRDYLRLEVQVLDFAGTYDSSSNYSYPLSAYERLHSGVVHMNLDLWPHSLPVDEGAAQMGSSSSSVRVLPTPIGHLGQSGWSIPTIVMPPPADTPWSSIVAYASVMHTLADRCQLQGAPVSAGRTCDWKPMHPLVRAVNSAAAYADENWACLLYTSPSPRDS